MHHKSDDTELLERFLAYARAYCATTKMVILRSVGGGEFPREKCRDLHKSRGIKQEFTTADSPQFNGVAERALGLIETAAMTGRVQARKRFPCAQLPATVLFWAEAWECRGYSMAKGFRKGIKQSMLTRTDKKQGRASVDLSVPKVVESFGGKRYTFIVRDDFPRYTWV